MKPQPLILTDSRSPYRIRKFRRGFDNLDPMSIPWKEMRRSPGDFPDADVAKVSAARTVVGITFVDADQKSRRIYVKRSLRKGALGRIAALVRESKELREFNLAGEFAKQGFVVPEPVYYSEASLPQDNAFGVFFATLALDERWRAAKAFFKETRNFGREWESLAVFTRALHEGKILHADYRSDHLYLDRDAIERGAKPRECWALIDLDGSRCGKPVALKQRERALKQLTESLMTSGVTERDVERFLAGYNAGKSSPLNAEKIYSAARQKSKRA